MSVFLFFFSCKSVLCSSEFSRVCKCYKLVISRVHGRDLLILHFSFNVDQNSNNFGYEIISNFVLLLSVKMIVFGTCIKLGRFIASKYVFSMHAVGR